jgi:4-diphosphocytidyl-2-C-methyl-D-erythritol kinase
MPLVVTEFAAAKINLALHVLGRRADGYHALDSIVAFADVGDELHVEAAPAMRLVVDGPFARDVPATSDNLVFKAHAALAQEISLPPVFMRLTKNLPVASGIGGGSADAAATLRALLRLVETNVEPAVLQRVALSLGADVPVCLHGKACRMQGVGEVITPLESSWAQAILLANPLQACGTADVFRAMGLKAGDVTGGAVDVDQPALWRNDMTAAACQVLPVIQQVLDALSQAPEKTAHRMSGSGATCFALFAERDMAEAARAKLAAQHPQWWVAAANLG